MACGVLGIISGVLLNAGQGLRRLVTSGPEIYELPQHFGIARVHAKRAFKLLLRLAPLVSRGGGAGQRQRNLWIGWHELLGYEKLLPGFLDLALMKIDRTQKQTFGLVRWMLLNSGLRILQSYGRISVLQMQFDQAVTGDGEIWQEPQCL